MFLGLYILMNILLEYPFIYLLTILIRAIDFQTSRLKTIKHQDSITKKKSEDKVRIWNPAVANLTLMVLGQSAPVIILMIYESLYTLNEPLNEQIIGPSSIIG